MTAIGRTVDPNMEEGQQSHFTEEYTEFQKHRWNTGESQVSNCKDFVQIEGDMTKI